MLRQRDEFLTELVTNARGLKYERYVFDSNGDKIPRKPGEVAPILGKVKATKEEKKTKLTGKALYKTELVTTARGVKYERLVKDAEGNKIPLTPAEIAVKMASATNSTMASKGADKFAKHVSRQLRKERKLCPVPRSIGAEMLKAYQRLQAENRLGALRSSEFMDGADDYKIILDNGDWFLIHMTAKKGDAWYFYNPVTHTSSPFVMAEHKKAPGNHNVQFPNGFRPKDEPLPDPVVDYSAKPETKKRKYSKKSKKAA